MTVAGTSSRHIRQNRVGYVHTGGSSAELARGGGCVSLSAMMEVSGYAATRGMRYEVLGNRRIMEVAGSGRLSL